MSGSNAFVGSAGWSVPVAIQDRFPQAGSVLQRYAAVLNCAEIDSSFNHAHHRKTYERWAASTPDHFRFCAKLPRLLTHEGGLVAVPEPLEAFLVQRAAARHADACLSYLRVVRAGRPLMASSVDLPCCAGFRPSRD